MLLLRFAFSVQKMHGQAFKYAFGAIVDDTKLFDMISRLKTAEKEIADHSIVGLIN